jgi:hypothetical protein
MGGLIQGGLVALHLRQAELSCTRPLTSSLRKLELLLLPKMNTHINNCINCLDSMEPSDCYVAELHHSRPFSHQACLLEYPRVHGVRAQLTGQIRL